MPYYLTAAVIILHTCFWGLGLAWLVVPRVWRRWWWVFVPGLGLALQSAVVWAGAHSPLAGTDSYALASEILPAVLLALAVKQAGFSGAWRRLQNLQAAAGVTVVLLVAGWFLLSPMAKASRSLTSTSLGSCDHADYAAGARVFKEFSRHDRTGFLGLPEVTRVRSAEYFFDFWLRLNHFTPSALIAHNATILHRQPYELISLTGAVLLLLNLSVVFMLARVGVGLRGWAALVVVAIYALSPLGAYAVHHGALGQLLAAQGIALLTLAMIGATLTAERGRGASISYDRSVWAFLPLALAALWILAGGYNFILTVALAPAIAWWAGRWWLHRRLRPIGQTLAMLGVSLAACVILFWGRFDGLIERFSLFEQYNFGWPVPVLSPEGWLGMVATVELWSWPPWVRAAASLLLLVVLLVAALSLWRRQSKHVLGMLALTVPAVLGWGILAFESRVRANASYDAFKLLSVFYPGLLAGLCLWLRLGEEGGRRLRWFVAVLALGALAANVTAANKFRLRMRNPPLRVDPTLVQVGRLETDPRIHSLNMRVEEFWARLWANAFLLKKPQYFATHTYEGRLNTELKGEWDLRESLLRTLPFRAADFGVLNTHFYIVRSGAAGLIDAQFGPGWYPYERSKEERWHWSNGLGVIELQNPLAQPVRARLKLQVRPVAARDLIVTIKEGGRTWRFPLGSAVQHVQIDDLIVPPGKSQLIIDSSEEPVRPGPGDARLLDVALFGFQLRSLAPVGGIGSR